MIEITAISGTKVAFDQGLLWIENDNRKTIALSKSEARTLVNAIMEWCAWEVKTGENSAIDGR